MWDEFYKDIDGQKFEHRNDFENYVRGWVEDTINEAGRLERWALNSDTKTMCEELNIEIKESENDL